MRIYNKKRFKLCVRLSRNNLNLVTGLLTEHCCSKYVCSEWESFRTQTVNSGWEWIVRTHYWNLWGIDIALKEKPYTFRCWTGNCIWFCVFQWILHYCRFPVVDWRIIANKDESFYMSGIIIELLDCKNSVFPLLLVINNLYFDSILHYSSMSRYKNFVLW